MQEVFGTNYKDHKELTYVYNGLLSFGFFCWVCNLILLVQIKFGGRLVTHLTMRPYIVSMFLFTVMVANYVMMSLYYDVVYDDKQFFKELHRFPSGLNRLNAMFICLKLTLVSTFILTRAHEQETLLAFLHFQR